MTVREIAATGSGCSSPVRQLIGAEEGLANALARIPGSGHSSRLAAHRAALGRDAGLLSAPREAATVNRGVSSASSHASAQPTPAAKSSAPAQVKQAKTSHDAAASKRLAKNARSHAVLSHPKAEGKHRNCQTLLHHPQNFSAAQIIGYLDEMPFDGDAAPAAASHMLNKSGSNVLKRSAVGGGNMPRGASPDVWARAHAFVFANTAAKPGAPTEPTAADVWARAHALAFPASARRATDTIA